VPFLDLTRAVFCHF